MCSSTSNAVTRPQVPERIGSSRASARITRMPLERATSAAESEYSSATARQPCSFRTRVLPPPAAPMSSARPGPGSRRSSRRSTARRSLYHQCWSSREVSSWSSAVSTTSLLQHSLRTFTACTELPYVRICRLPSPAPQGSTVRSGNDGSAGDSRRDRSEEHTSELQSRRDLVCRLLLEKKKKEIMTELKDHKYKGA